MANYKVASRPILEKYGFTVVGEEVGFAAPRGEEIEVLVLELAVGQRGLR